MAMHINMLMLRSHTLWRYNMDQVEIRRDNRENCVDALIFTCHSEVMERDTVCAISACAQVGLEEQNIRTLEGFARFGLE